MAFSAIVSRAVADILRRGMRIGYLVEDASLTGGLRVVLGQADALVARGHSVVIFAKSGAPDWRETAAEWRTITDFSQVRADDLDFLIGTFWTTIHAAYALAGSRAVHLCQGYEGEFSAYVGQREEIDSAYRLPIAKIVVSPHLVEVCRRFATDVHWIGQIVDRAFFGEPAWGAARRVLLIGAYEIDFKGIDVGYETVRLARLNGSQIELVRVSPWAPAAVEPLDLVQEFHVGLGTGVMASVMRSCGTFLGPSRRDEGFGLPAAEAMAMGIPAVLTEIPSFLSFASPADYALFAGEDDAPMLSAQLARLLTDQPLRKTLAKRGAEVAAQFTAARVAERIEHVLTKLPPSNSAR